MMTRLKTKTLFTFCVLLVTAFYTDAKVIKKKAVLTTKIVMKRTDQERIVFLIKIAKAYQEDGNPKAAVEAYEKILKIKPDLIQAQYVISQLYILAKEEKKAEDILLKLIKKFPNDSKLWNNLAWLYATSDDLSFRNGKRALKYAHEALILSPNDYHIWDTLSQAYYISGDYKKAYRAAKQMAMLAIQHGDEITKEQLKKYNQQIRKCKRACDIEKEEGQIKKTGIKKSDSASLKTNSVPKEIPSKK